MAEEGKTVNPSVKWAQRKTLVYITIEAKDLAEEGRSIDLQPDGKLVFKGKNKDGTVNYLREIALFNDVVIDESKWKVTDFSVQFSVSKQDKEAEFWPRLLKEPGKQQWLAADWDKWADESDEEGDGAQDLDFGDMQGFGDEEDEDDSDEEEDDEEEGQEEAKAGIEDLGV